MIIDQRGLQDLHLNGYMIMYFETSPLCWQCNNISSVVEFQRWWVLKSKIFCPRINMLKGKKNLPMKKSSKIVLWKSIFYVRNRWIFLKFSFKNINLGDHFLLKKYFLASIFEPLYFLKPWPIFDKLSFINGIFNFFSLQVCWLLAKNLAF